VTATPGSGALLLVDDNEDNRYTLSRRLRREGYENLTTANDGQQALDLLQSRPFDLVLLDVMMPGLNGYDVHERMRADIRLRHIPVIMISALDETGSVIRCVELGAEDYLPKPFNPTLLRARVGASLEKKRLRDEIVQALSQIEAELQAARQIQLSMVPTEFLVPTSERPVEVYATLEPARRVGGDLYDFFWGEDGRMYFVVADVSGKGAPAALFMARTKTMIRLIATLYRLPEGGPMEPHRIIEKVNEGLSLENQQDMFVTVFLGVLDPATATLSFCNAGHNLPYLVRKINGVSAVNGARGKPLGIRPTFTYQTESLELAPGDSLFVYTDGITEALNTADELFSDERLEEALRSLTTVSVSEMVSGVMERVRAFAAGAVQADDIAAMALRFVK
jgi:sigma-B regulation protein RsbU (phosphoserine phosphatase)